LWFWCSRPCCGPELRRWLRDAPVDHSVFRPAQLIYTAAPVFADGVQDHLPTRMAMLHGDESALPVPSKTALAPPPPRSVKLPAAGSAGGSRYALAALIKATSRVAQAAVNSRHCTMVAEARGLSRLIGAGLLTVAEVKHALGRAAETAGKTADEAEAVLEWALAHPSSARPSDGAGR